jgi:hypothetical protein
MSGLSINHNNDSTSVNYLNNGVGDGLKEITISSNNDTLSSINNPVVINSSAPNLSISESHGPIRGDTFGMDLLANDKTKQGSGYVSGGEESNKSYNSDHSQMSNQSQNYNKEKYEFINNYNNIDNQNNDKINSNINIENDVTKFNSAMDDSTIHMDPLDPAIYNPSEQNQVMDDDLKPIHLMSGGEIKNEKIDYIYKFKKLENNGIRTSQQYSMNSNLEEMRNEYLRLKRQREVDNSVKFQRKMLMACVTGIEFLNSKFDPFDVKLDGWSESVNDNVNDYDEIFEELYDKYNTKTNVAPELKLMFALGGSAFMFHLTNTMFKSALPGMDDIMKQNPDLMKQFASAAMNSVTQQKSSQSMGGDMPMPGMFGMGSQMNMGGSSMSPGTRPEMRGPDKSNLDNIINNLNTRDLPDVDNISIRSGSDINGGGSETKGISLNL